LARKPEEKLRGNEEGERGNSGGDGSCDGYYGSREREREIDR
jgi:hypothetical protein